MYKYFGLIFGRLSATVRLESAIAPQNGDHAAVWAGVNSRNIRRWVQGGVEITHGDAYPSAYIETQTRSYAIKFVPVKFGTPVKVKLRRRRGYWTATISGKNINGADFTRTSRPVYIQRPVIDAMLETFGRVKAVAKINRKVIRSK